MGAGGHKQMVDSLRSRSSTEVRGNWVLGVAIRRSKDG